MRAQQVRAGITKHLFRPSDTKEFCWAKGGSVKHEIVFFMGNFPVARCGFKRAAFVGNVQRPICKRCLPLREEAPDEP